MLKYKKIPIFPILLTPEQRRLLGHLREIDELEVRLQMVSGYTLEKLIELFAKGYTLQPPEQLTFMDLFYGPGE